MTARLFFLGAAAVMGLAAIANGMFMLGAPQSWYLTVPGVTMTGPFNQHFVRDLGLIYLLAGASFLAGVRNSGFRLVLWAVPTIWLSGHALFHVWEVAVGISGHSAMARDFPAVTLPAIVGSALAFWAMKTREATPEADALKV
ncbi:MAG TPA: hypothetical protein VK485_05650 [Sphingomicrobium sp.]|nr:hypothetical protein [Sphingomicrobium sp.]